MIHGLYGTVECSSTKHKCSKFFAKKLQIETTLNEDGFPMYRKRENTNKENMAFRNGIYLDNRFVIPHHVDLVVKFKLT